MTVKAIPEGYHSITPYMIVDDCDSAIEFYKKVFAATELMRMPGPDGKIGHAEIRVGDSTIMMADEHPAMGFKGPKTLGGSAVSLMLYVEDVDDCFRRAVEAGAKVVRELQNQFYGDRSATLTDPYGHVWTIATHVEDVEPDEMERRAEAYMKEQGSQG